MTEKYDIRRCPCCFKDHKDVAVEIDEFDERVLRCPTKKKTFCVPKANAFVSNTVYVGHHCGDCDEELFGFVFGCRVTEGNGLHRHAIKYESLTKLQFECDETEAEPWDRPTPEFARMYNEGKLQ